MSDKLIIVESPTKIKSIKKIVGKDYDLAASVGHIRDLPQKKLGVDLENDFSPQYTMLKGKEKVISELRKQATGHKEIYLACDPDREGEAIAWHLKEALAIPEERLFRITTNEITKEGVLEALNNPRTINMDKVNAQQARRILDRLVGYKISPLLWKKIKSGLSAGRVQSVAVKLIVEREKEIRAFKPEEYWTIDAECMKNGDESTVFTANLAKKNGNAVSIPDQKSADAIVSELGEHPFTVSELKRKKIKSHPYPPFKTSTMQRRASIMHNFSASKTMRVAQQLYEGIEIGSQGSTGLITYMRTDSTRVADSALEQVRTYIEEEYGKDYLSPEVRQYEKDDRAQDAHEAIRPTNVELTPDSIEEYLSPEQYKLYRLIWNQFVTSQMSDALYNSTSVTIDCGPYQFKAQGREMVFDGYTKVLGAVKTKLDKQHIPQLEKGEELSVRKIDPEQHFTKPPSRYSQATLIKMLEKEGIGRPSTYSTIISTITNRNYVRIEKNAFHATLLGITVTERLEEYFSDIMDVTFTANFENKLDAIAEAQADWIEVLHDFYNPFSKDLETALSNMKSTKGEDAQRTIYKCKECGKTLVIRWGKNGPFLGCEGFFDKENKCSYTAEMNEDGTMKEISSGPIEGAEYEGSPIYLKNGRYGYYFETETGIRAALPRTINPEDVTPEIAVQTVTDKMKSEEPLCTLENGDIVYYKVGRYGPYFQVTNGDDKRNIALPRTFNKEEASDEEVTLLVSLPKAIGDHPETGEEITLNFGKYGGFVKSGDKTHSIGSMNLTEVDVEKAVELLAKPKKKKKKAKKKKS